MSNRFYLHCACGNEMLFTEEQIGSTVKCFQCDGDLRVIRPTGDSDQPPHDAPPVTAGPKRDLAMEAHLICIGGWLRIDALWNLVSGVFTGPGFWVYAIVFVYACLVFWAGHLLARFSTKARVVLGVLAWVVAGLTLLLTLYLGAQSSVWRSGRGLDFRAFLGVAVILNLSVGYGIVGWLLLSRRASEVCTADYENLVELTPDQRPVLRRSPFFWLPLIVIGFSLMLYLF